MVPPERPRIGCGFAQEVAGLPTGVGDRPTCEIARHASIVADAPRENRWARGGIASKSRCVRRLENAGLRPQDRPGTARKAPRSAHRLRRTPQRGRPVTDTAHEILRLAALRDAGHLTEAEFAAAKARVLRPKATPFRSPLARLLDRVTVKVLTLCLAVGALVGTTTVIAMTEAGAIALLSLALVSLVLLGFWLFHEML
jgi:hypothetical protein